MADPEPIVITLLRSLKFAKDARPAGRYFDRDKADKLVDEILTNWEKGEKLSQLRTSLGLDDKKGSGRRRRQLSVKREEEICFAVVNAALNGNSKPMKVAADNLDIGDRQVQRAWKKWETLHIESLKAMCGGHAGESARRALDILDRH